MEVLLWSLVGFISGAIPFSVLIARGVRGVDIRTIGDKNPGSTNVMRSAGKGWGLAAMLLDALKGAIPVGLAWFAGDLHGWQIIPVATAPVFGHAFSPFLGWKGGKAVAATFGVWAGLTLGVVPTVFGLLLGLTFTVLATSGWAVIAAYLLLGWFIRTYYGGSAPEFLGVWGVILLLLIWKHREELSTLPGLHPQVLRWVQRRQP